MIKKAGKQWLEFFLHKRTVSMAYPETHSAHKLLISRTEKRQQALCQPPDMYCVYSPRTVKICDVTHSLFPVFLPLSCTHLSFSWVLGLVPRRRMSKYSHHGWTGAELPSLQKVPASSDAATDASVFIPPWALQTYVLRAHHCFLWFISLQLLNLGPQVGTKKKASQSDCCPVKSWSLGSCCVKIKWSVLLFLNADHVVTWLKWRISISHHLLICKDCISVLLADRMQKW